eukprot:753323-Hanusia_phi.AAC.1
MAARRAGPADGGSVWHGSAVPVTRPLLANFRGSRKREPGLGPRHDRTVVRSARHCSTVQGQALPQSLSAEFKPGSLQSVTVSLLRRIQLIYRGYLFVSDSDSLRGSLMTRRQFDRRHDPVRRSLFSDWPGGPVTGPGVRSNDPPGAGGPGRPSCDSRLMMPPRRPGPGRLKLDFRLTARSSIKLSWHRVRHVAASAGVPGRRTMIIDSEVRPAAGDNTDSAACDSRLSEET